MNLIFFTLLLTSFFLAFNLHSFALHFNPTYYGHLLLQLKGDNNGTSLGNVQETLAQNHIGNEQNKIHPKMKKSRGGGVGHGGRGFGGSSGGNFGSGAANRHPTGKKKNDASAKWNPLKYATILSFAFANMLI